MQICQSNPDSRYMSILEEFALQLVDTGPKHHTGDIHTWIELLFIDQCYTILDLCHKSTPFCSRHDVIPVTIEWYLQSVPTESSSCRKFGSIISNNIFSLLNNYDWSIFSLPANQFDITQGLLTLTKYLQEAIDDCSGENYHPSQEKISLNKPGSPATLT